MTPLFLERLASGPPLVLDGATGTELARRGVALSLPLWSARALLDAPDVLRAIHADYVAAGADIVTACTFRTHARNLVGAGLADRAAELTVRAVEIARSAGAPLVAGSLSPLEDCYRPDLTPPASELAREHALQAERLADAGVDLILVETQPTIREAIAATRAATTTGVAVTVSLVCDARGRLLSGETLTAAAEALTPLAPAAILVNCLPCDAVLSALAELRTVVGNLPLGAYANIGRRDERAEWQTTDAADPDRYAQYARSWLDAGARIVGGCCGTQPAHIARLRTLL